MNLKEKIKELEEKNRELEKQLNKLLSSKKGESNSSTDTVLRAFHSADYLMALAKADSGNYIDVNTAFLETLGFQREEVIGHSPEDIGLYADIEEINKYIRILARLKKIKDFVITLRTKKGEKKLFLLTANTVQLDDGIYLMSQFTPIPSKNQLKISESQGTVLAEIFDTVSAYLALFSVGTDDRFYIADINSKVEEVEFIDKNEVIGKCIDDTPLGKRAKLVELLNHLRLTKNAHKLAASTLGDDSEGFYVGFILTSGNIVITWEPGRYQKSSDDIKK